MIKTLLSIGFLALLIGTDVFALSSNEKMRINNQRIENQQIKNLNNYNLVKASKPKITTVSVNNVVDSSVNGTTYRNHSMHNNFNGPTWLYPIFLIGKCTFIIVFLGLLTFVVRRSWVLASKKK